MPTEKNRTTKAYAFIDASNPFYGGEKSLGWKFVLARGQGQLERLGNLREAIFKILCGWKAILRLKIIKGEGMRNILSTFSNYRIT